MRNIAVIIGALTAVLLTGCAGHQTPEAAAPRTSSTAAPGPTEATSPSAPTSAGAAQTGQTQPGGPTPTRSVDPENPQDLRGAQVTLTGTVHATPNCIELDTGTGRWLLVGPIAAGLRDGMTATVRGRPAPAPAGCAAQSAIEVQNIG